MSDPTLPQPQSTTDLSTTEARTAVGQLDDRISRHAITGAPVAAGYRILGKLGEGTYGTVWLAEDRAGVRVAIKFFAHGTDQQWKLLQDEVQSLARLDTTFGIIPLKEVRPDADPPYFVMSYAEGGSLQQRLATGPVPVGETLKIITDVARALAFVHAKGIRHCDLKPGNVLLNQHGQPLIADFGQAHLSDDAAPALGTFFYMAPEQAEPGLQIPDTRWDVYGLGAIAYAMLTGEPPRKDTGLSEELRKTEKLHHRLKIYRDRIRSLPLATGHRTVRGVDAMLARIIDHCLELEPAKRLRDAGAVLDALATRARQQRQRPMLLFGVLAPLLVLVLMLGIGSLAARDAIGEARAGLTDQLLDSDLVTARLSARVLEEKLSDGVLLIEDFAAAGNEPRLATLLQPLAALPPAAKPQAANLKPGAAAAIISARSPSSTRPATCWLA
jgi:serine/threonine protein kinase